MLTTEAPWPAENIIVECRSRKEDGADTAVLRVFGNAQALDVEVVRSDLACHEVAEQLGKPVLSDIKEGKVTLPLIYAMENGHSEARELVARVLEEKEFVSVQPEKLVALVRDSGAFDRTRDLAHDYARRAKACLNGNGESDYGRALLTLPDFILEREY